MKYRTSVLATGMLFACLMVCRLPAEGEATTGPTDEERAAHLAKMQKIAQSINVYELSDKQRTPSKLVDKPALKYRDDTRKLFESTMWVWGTEGRPSAMIAVEYYPQMAKEPKWLYEIASLSTERIAAERGAELNWTARGPGLKLQVLTAAPAPAETPARRLTQMRELRNRFAAHERAPVGGRIELKPLSAPLHRYQNAKSGLLDGAVFAFANGTNPEVLWVIEAHRDDQQKTTWQYGLVQMTGAEVFVDLNEKQIWQCAEADPPAERDGYLNGWMTSDKDGE